MAPDPKYPVGYKFHPTDEDLLGHYLYNRVAKGLAFKSDDIHDCDLFGDIEPWVVWEEYGGSDDGEPLFFFTKRKYLSLNSKRFGRRVASGTWSGQVGKEVVAKVKTNGRRTKRVTGTKRDFKYERGSRSDQNNCWLMHELELNPGDQWVICIMKKNPRNAPPKATTNGQMSNKKRKEVVDHHQPMKKTKTTERKASMAETSSALVPKMEEINYKDQNQHQVLGAGLPSYQDDNPAALYPEFYPELCESNEPAQFWMEELLAGIAPDVGLVSNDQFQHQAYQGNSFMSLISNEDNTFS